MISDESRLILILRYNENSSSDTGTIQYFVKSIINTPKKYSRIIVQITVDPLTYFRKVFRLKVLNNIIDIYIAKVN